MRNTLLSQPNAPAFDAAQAPSSDKNKAASNELQALAQQHPAFKELSATPQELKAAAAAILKNKKRIRNASKSYPLPLHKCAL